MTSNTHHGLYKLIKYKFCVFTSYGLDKNTICTETARTSEIHR